MNKKTIAVDVKADLSVFAQLAKQWPSLKYGINSYLGYHGRRALYEEFLRGQVIDLRAYPTDSRGRRTVSYSILKRGKGVKISAYPLNLFNPQSVYSAAAPVVQSRINSKLSEYDKVLQNRIDSFERGQK